MFPNSRHVCYILSPFILLYAVCLLLIQFVFGMNLTELPKEVNGIKLADIGLKTFTYPCLQLALQVGFVSFISVTLDKTLFDQIFLIFFFLLKKQIYCLSPNYSTVRLSFSKLLGTLICGKICIYLLRMHCKKDQKRTYLMMTMRFFSDFLYKGICCWYSFELHRQVSAIQMSTYNICLCKEVKKKVHWL